MNKKTEISFLNVVFCLMVIFIHVTSYPISSLPADSILMKILFSLQKLCGVAVYGFIFLSGLKLFLNMPKKFDIKKYYISRFKKIVVPYILFTIFYYVYESYRGYHTFNIKELLTFFINGNVECHLYFIVIITQFYILLPLWRGLTKFKAIYVLPVALIINIVFSTVFSGFAYNDRIFTSYLFYWLMGCFCGLNYEKFIRIIKNKKNIILILFLLFFVADTTLLYFSFIGRLGLRSEIVEIIHLLHCIISVIFFYLVSLFAKQFKVSENGIIKAVNNASYEIYLVHIFFVHIANDMILKFKDFGILDAYAFRFLFVYILSLGVCIMYKKLICLFSFQKT